MNDAFQDFGWQVAPGYRWRDWLDDSGAPVGIPDDDLLGVDSEDQVLLTWDYARDRNLTLGPVLEPAMAAEGEPLEYKPMQRAHAALFREFAELDFSSTHAVHTFASRYGLLGLGLRTQTLHFVTKDGAHVEHYAHGEPFIEWAAEICMMREGLRLGARQRTFAQTRRLKWLFDRNLQHVQARLAFGAGGKPKVLLEPLTLIAAMWLQLALDVTGDKRFVACKFCRKVFEISTAQTGFRSHREFCSGSCKTLDYRRRQRTAGQMAADGIGATEIAQQLDTSVETVERWLRNRTLPVSKPMTGES